MQGAIRDKIAKGTVIWKRKSVCLALSMNYDYSKGGKVWTFAKKDWSVKGQLEPSARVTMHYLFNTGRTESLSTATHTLLETLVHRELMKHFLQRERAGYFRQVIDSTLGTDVPIFRWGLAAFSACGPSLCGCLLCAVRFTQDALCKQPTLALNLLGAQKNLTK